ncbi:hypothetical protein AWB91_09405 [Mycobacterium paraense]|uniref:Methyltransferase type 11 domain-containing protein n=1 Tax=Mycobacterium paraense TaxID=767916 RepID=A0ABX3VSL0_9MYCO|nr:hypothetical protein AWB91_09405 [Mycobacterium paraense]ORW34612.1 hypothetical protein AWB88_02365 [Mycobacterium paraense]
MLLASLFTHMLPSDVKHYLHEIVRVLKPGGRNLNTFFLLNEESSALIKEGKASFNFQHEMPGYRTTHAEHPEAAIAYPEAFVRYLYGECGLELREPLRYGTWCGRTNGMSGQDVVIAVKVASGNRLAQGVPMSDIERPKRPAKHPLISLPDKNTVNPATTPVSGASKTIPRMSPAAAEEYIASLYTTVLKRDPNPNEFAHWVATAAAWPPEQVYFAFVKSEEYKLQQKKSVRTMFPPGHYYSPIVDPSTIAEYVEKQYLQEPGDIQGIHFDEEAMVRFWKENAEFIKDTPFSEYDDGKNRYYYNHNYPYGDAMMLRAMIAYFKPKNVIEVGSGFSSACMLDAADHVGLSDFAMTCIDPDADRLRSRLREEDHYRVDIIEGLVQDVPVSTFSKLNENDILFIDSTHVLKTASDVHYELFSILPSLNKGVLVHFHDIQYPFEYPRQWLFENNHSWNEIYAVRAFLMYNSAFEVVFWNDLFAHRQRELVHETNPLFLKNPGGSIWLRVRSIAPRSGLASLSDGINDTQNGESIVRASSEPAPDLLPQGRFPLRDWPPSDGTLTVIEAPKVEQLRPPEFVCNLSDKTIPDWVITRAQIHGSYLVSRADVLLFGPNHLVSQSGLWSCETRTFKRQFMELVRAKWFSHFHPGAKPGIDFEGDEIVLDCNTLSQYDVDSITEPVFLATPLEPDNWGRWIATTLPKCAQFKEFGNGRKFFCRAAHPWQRDLLHLMGIDEAQVLEHDPGKTYICRDALTVEYSATNMTVSEAEKQVYADLADACRRDSADTFGERIFVSRLSTSAKHPHYRVLQNERELIGALGELGFKAVQPEQLPLKEQIGMFARAKYVVALGGAGLFSVRFCPAGTTVVTIESNDYFIREHSMMLSSMGHRFGVIFGQQDPSDPTPVHKRWTIDVQRAYNAIREIL